MGCALEMLTLDMALVAALTGHDSKLYTTSLLGRLLVGHDASSFCSGTGSSPTSDSSHVASLCVAQPATASS